MILKLENPLLLYHDIQQFDVLLVKIEGPVWYTIYHHHLAVVNKGVNTIPNLFINQP